MALNNFHYGQVLLSMIYNVELSDDDYEEYGMLAWNLIGNKNVKLYRFKANIEEDNSITLPCNAVDGEIEAVTTNFEDWETVKNNTNWGDIDSFNTEQRNEMFKTNISPYYSSGKFIKYQKIGDKLYFDRNYGQVNILYKGILLDDEGLPEISDKEAQAISTYVAYVLKFKEGLITNNPQIIQLANTLKTNWLQQCDQARVAYLNQNDMNNILDVKTSWNRHSFGKSYKPIF